MTKYLLEHVYFPNNDNIYNNGIGLKAAYNRNNRDMNSVCIVCDNNNIEILEILLKKYNIDPNGNDLEGKDHYPPILFAAINGNLDIFTRRMFRSRKLHHCKLKLDIF